MDITSVVLANDLLAWAEKAGAQFHKENAGWRSHCPIHAGNNKSAFSVYEEGGKQKWKCHTGPCGGGDVVDFVMKWQGCDLKAAYEILGGERKPDPLAVARAAQEQAERAAAQLQSEIERSQRVLDDLRRTQSWLTWHANLLEDDSRRQLWRKRGLPDDWQDYWQLGFCPKFTILHDGVNYNTPTLTIPVLDELDQLVNVRHRLLSPPVPNDKYRPERPGLAAAPFIAYRTAGYDADRILVVEGEIKAAVTFSTIYRDTERLQVIGIPGKNAYRSIVDKLRGHEVYICFDPDADAQAEQAAREVGGKVMTIPMKIDDAILAGCLDRRSLYLRMKAARKA